MVSLNQAIKKYRADRYAEGIKEVLVTFFIYLTSLLGMYFTFRDSLLITFMFVLLNGFAIIRLFIIQHDCSHASLFPDTRANYWVGRFLSLFTLTPFFAWKWQHLIHHSGSGNLEKRGIGDIVLLTVEEYDNLNSLQKMGYRIKRSFFMMLFVFAPIYFLIVLRAPAFFLGYRKHSLYTKKIFYSALLTNLSLLIFYGLFVYLFKTSFLLIYIGSIYFASTALTLGFYGHHNFPNTYFVHAEEWDYTAAALKGSSVYKLPKILEWFIYYINYHSVHHLYPKIPGYHLKQCHNENIIFHQTPIVTLKDIGKLARLKLYDTRNQRMISWTTYRLQKRGFA